MNAARIESTPDSRVLIITGLCFVVSMYCGCSEIAYGTNGKTHRADPCDRADTSEVQPPIRGTRRSKPPNVLLIGIETLRADHVGCLGYKEDTTPTLDRMAQEGVLCTRTMSTSGWTLPSVMSVMTSLYPDVHQVYTYKRRLPDEITTLAEVLRARGYTTAGFISNPMVHSKYGFSDGFTLYDDFTIALDSGLDMFGNHDDTINDQHHVCTSELLTRTTVRWLERQSDDPFFLFVFYMDPHYDYIPPPPFDTMFDPNYHGAIDGRNIRKEPRHSQRPSDRDLQHLLALYDGEIRYTDTHVAELLQAFAKEELLANTLVVIFGDHGDEFYEHGKTAHDRTLYDEIIHVPLIFWWPERLAGGKRIETVTSLVDTMPTMLDYLNLPHEGLMQGVSLRPLIEGTSDGLRDTVWAELNTWTHVQAVIGNHDKLIRNVGTDTWELYRLLHDSGEQTNLYDLSSAADTGLAMVAKWEQWTKNNQALAEDLARGNDAEKIPLDEQHLLRLKALGYVQ